MSIEVPQPWHGYETGPISREEHLERALEAEANGARLATWTFVDAYPDPLGEENGWIVEEIIISDWRTGEVLFAYGMDDDDPDVAGLFDVEHRSVSSIW